MTEVYLALGANVGDAEGNINKAVDLLGRELVDIKRAPLYRSKAAGYSEQPDFVNTAISGQTELSPAELLTFIKNVETKVGRVERFRWGPREIDIDIIFYGRQVISQYGLKIPHASFRERDFVLKPLIELEPGLTDPVEHKKLTELLEHIKPENKTIS
jgi:2-amino-4-hydroxy-6-hydroxymethyldihydropteridine diphosphokinase